MANQFPASVTIDQGRTLSFSVVWQDQSGVPYDLTNYTASFSVASDYQQTPIFTLTVGSGITLTPLTGTISVVASGTQTNLLTATSYAAELVLTSPTGVSTSLLKSYILSSRKVVP